MKLRIASFNVWGLPWPAGHEVAARVGAIGDRLGALRADLVAIQEVWTDAARDQLVLAAQAADFEGMWHPARAAGGSGLLVLSRLRIEAVHFEAFDLRGLPQRIWHGDYHGGKGFAAVRLATPDGPIALIDTHLHARYGPVAGDPYLGHRMGQVVQLAAFLASVDVPILAAGDFNFEEDSAEYRVLTGLTHLRDGAAVLDRRESTVRASHPYADDRELDKRIDYLFARDGADRSVFFRAFRRIYDGSPPSETGLPAFSDHDGVLTEVEISPGGAPVAPPDFEAQSLAARVLEDGRKRALSRRRTERLAAGGGLAFSVGALGASRRAAVSRRGVLRAAGLLALAGGLSIGALAELAIPEELAAYDRTLERLQALGEPRSRSWARAARTHPRSSLTAVSRARTASTP